MKFKKRRQQGADLDSWLISYADMITLLLAFFVIFISTSEPQLDKLAAATQGMQAEFGSVDIYTPFDGVYRDIQGAVEKHQAFKNIAIEQTSRGIQMEIDSAHIFERGVAEIAPETMPLLEEMARSVKGGAYAGYTIHIEAHTDNTLPDSPFYTSNWELSAAQAARVARFFIEQGIEARHISATAYADTQPLVPNKDKEGNAIPANQKQNQRIAVKIEQ